MPPSPHRTRRPLARYALLYAVLTVLAAIVLLPFYWMVVSSFRAPEALFSSKPSLWLSEPVLVHYAHVLRRTPFVIQFENSAIVALCTTLACILTGSFAGYSLSRFRFTGKLVIAVVIFLAMMFPATVVLIPMFLVFRTLKLLNTYAGLIIAYATFALPFCTWMMKGFIDSIPVELEEAAIVDGCSRAGAMFRITLPLAAPGVAATAMFGFLLAWNEYLFALTLTTSEDMRTLPVGLTLFSGEYYTNYGALMAASLMICIPVLVFFLYTNKYMIQGLTAGAVNG
jgi:ABC-type glycerol-3-phosphate transport system permease component